MPQNPGQLQEDPLLQYRNGVADAIDLIEGMAPLCGSIEEMVSMFKLSLKNDAQLNLILKQVTPTRLRK